MVVEHGRSQAAAQVQVVDDARAQRIAFDPLETRLDHAAIPQDASTLDDAALVRSSSAVGVEGQHAAGREASPSPVKVPEQFRARAQVADREVPEVDEIAGRELEVRAQVAMHANHARGASAREDHRIEIQRHGVASGRAGHEGASQQSGAAAVFAEARRAGSMQAFKERAQLLGILHRGFVE